MGTPVGTLVGIEVLVGVLVGVDVESGALFGAQLAERHIGDAGHGSKDHGDVDREGAEPQSHYAPGGAKWIASCGRVELPSTTEACLCRSSA